MAHAAAAMHSAHERCRAHHEEDRWPRHQLQADVDPLALPSAAARNPATSTPLLFINPTHACTQHAEAAHKNIVA